MRKFLVALATLVLALGATAQTDTTVKVTIDTVRTVTEPAVSKKDSIPKKKKDWSKINLTGRANDHFMFQVGYDNWAQAPDSIRITGFGRHLNIYFMLDFPFKSNPRFSVGLGAGIGSSNIFFDKQEPQIAATTTNLEFRDVADTNHFKKFKLSNTWAEVPLELRFVANPENTNKSWKIAIGAKLGTMINAHTKGKTLENSSDNTLNSYTEKVNSKRYFNNFRFAATARVGYGPFGLYGAYQVNSLIKENVGPQVRPWSIGLVVSGL